MRKIFANHISEYCKELTQLNCKKKIQKNPIYFYFIFKMIFIFSVIVGKHSVKKTQFKKWAKNLKDISPKKICERQTGI